MHCFRHHARVDAVRSGGRDLKGVPNAVAPCHMRGKREARRAAEEYGRPNGSRRRRVYCAARDAVSGIRGSGLVGTCYEGVMMAVWSSDHSIQSRPARFNRPYRHAAVRKLSRRTRARDRFPTVERTRAPERRRAPPSASERRPERRRKIRRTDPFLRSGIYLFKADLFKTLKPIPATMSRQ